MSVGEREREKSERTKGREGRRDGQRVRRKRKKNEGDVARIFILRSIDQSA